MTASEDLIGNLEALRKPMTDLRSGEAHFNAGLASAIDLVRDHFRAGHKAHCSAIGPVSECGVCGDEPTPTDQPAPPPESGGNNAPENGESMGCGEGVTVAAGKPGEAIGRAENAAFKAFEEARAQDRSLYTCVRKALAAYEAARRDPTLTEEGIGRAVEVMVGAAVAYWIGLGMFGAVRPADMDVALRALLSAGYTITPPGGEHE